MALDGSPEDSLTGEDLNRRLRPATYEYAVAALPQFILLLKRGRLTLHFLRGPDGSDFVRAVESVPNGRRWIMLRSDFDICKGITKKVAKLFLVESDEAYLGRILAQVKVAFAGRGIPI